MCSDGDPLAQQNEQQQLDFSKQLTQIFQAQYSDQHDVLQFLQGALTPMIQNPTGYSDSALASLKTGAVDSISSQYDKANQALNNNYANVDPSTTSGIRDMQTGALKSAQATDTAGALNTIDLNNENLKQNNYWNALNILSGNVASQYNPVGYAGAETGASNSSTNAGSLFQSSKQSQLLGALGGIAGGAGTALSGYFGKG